MIFYVTYNDLPSGIFSSQVIDTVKFMNTELNANVKLVSFISLRGFVNNRSKIKKEFSEAIVLPMFPGIKRWRANKWLLALMILMYKPSAIIGRSVLATQLGLMLKHKKLIKKVVYDGRGAISAEWHEYKVVSDPKMLAEISYLEKEVVLMADYRIAVSNQLVLYWEKECNYRAQNHVIIPCTVNKVFEKVEITEAAIKKSRELLGVQQTDIVFIYSGSLAGWQSFNLLYDFLKPILSKSSNVKILFLSELDANIIKLKAEFKDKVICKKVGASEVPNYLIVGDYGLLIREESVTNKVASPVKFAEYIACGLNVIISKNLGDYSEFVAVNGCGYVVDGFSNKLMFNNISKVKNINLANTFFCKNTFHNQYAKLVKHAC